jgi:MFS transporter, PHS family, inorganic phosphate transporter
LLASGLLLTSLSHDFVWRILLAFGAVPALAVFEMRRHMAETPRYLLATGQHDEFHQAASGVLASLGKRMQAKKATERQNFWRGFEVLTGRRRCWPG